MTFVPYNVDDLTPPLTWLSNVFKAANPDMENFYRRLEQVTVDEAVTFLTETVFTHGRKREVTSGVADAILRRQDLTVEHIKAVAAGYIRYSAGEEVFGTLIKRKQRHPGQYDFDETVVRMISSYACDVSTLGSLCRTLEVHAEKRRSVLTEDVTSALLNSKDCPIEVVARIFNRRDDGRRYMSRSYWTAGDRFERRIADTYPDLADLPEQMLLDCVASQPIPDPWFVDAWEIGESGELRVDSPYIHNGDFLWMDLTDRRRAG